MSLTEKIEQALPDGAKPTQFAAMLATREFMENSMPLADEIFRARLADQLPEPWAYVTIGADKIDPERDWRYVSGLTIPPDAVLVAGISYEPKEDPSDMLARLQDFARTLPKPLRAARVEVGQGVLDRLKAAARVGSPPDDPWKPAGWTPPPSPFDSLLGIPIVVRDELDPGAWRVLDHDGQVISEGLCP